MATTKEELLSLRCGDKVRFTYMNEVYDGVVMWVALDTIKVKWYAAPNQSVNDTFVIDLDINFHLQCVTILSAASCVCSGKKERRSLFTSTYIYCLECEKEWSGSKSFIDSP